MKISVERGWDDIDRGESKCWDQNLSLCHFYHHKAHMDGFEITKLYTSKTSFVPHREHNLSI